MPLFYSPFLYLVVISIAKNKSTLNYWIPNLKNQRKLEEPS